MLHVGICDDESTIVTYIFQLLEDIKKSNKIDMEIHTFTKGVDLLNSFNELPFDLVYLDIEMAEADGLQIGHSLRNLDPYCIIIYISGYDNYLMELFEIEAFRFIKKPIDVQLFNQYFIQALDKIRKNDFYFEYVFKGEFHRIATKDILYFESNLRTINITVKDPNQTICFYGKLNDIEKKLNNNQNDFLRIHQSYLINITYIKTLRYSEVVMRNDSILRISKDRQKEIRDKWMTMLMQ